MDMPLPARANLRCLHNEDTSLVVFTGMFVIIRREQRDGGINKVYLIWEKGEECSLRDACDHTSRTDSSVRALSHPSSFSQPERHN